MGLLVRKRTIPGWVKVPLAAAAAGALGFGIGQTGLGGPQSHANEPKTPPPVGTPVPSDLKLYTYSGSNCADGDEKDPISVVFVNDGFPDWIRAHMSHITGWSSSSEGDQYFGAAPNGQAECEPADGDAWRNVGFCPPAVPCDRFHVRFYMHQYQGAPRVHPTYGGFASASPHYEKRVQCGLWPDHAVVANSQEFQINKITVAGGFNYGREEIKKTWVRRQHSVAIPFPDPLNPIPPATHDHPLVDNRNWDNTAMMRQCNGWEAYSSGRVFYIGVKAA